MQPKDKAFIWDIYQASNDILEFTNNISAIDFENKKLIRFAVERQLLVIGEASHHLSTEFMNENPQIPWKQMIGLRNIIAHEYGEILTERIWMIVKNNIPELKMQIEFLKLF
jgi:uncharacterized protein with HEPN domain